MAKKQTALSWEVTGSESGKKLLDFLKNKLHASSNRELKRKIEANLFRLNEKPERFASAIVKKGDIVTFFDEALPEEHNHVFDISRILWEDEYILIYDKPSGFVCDANHVKKLRSDLILTHRLDKDTTGVIVFAKKIDAAQAIEMLFQKRMVSKSYLAIVDKKFKHNHGVIENYLGKIKSYQGNSIYGQVSKDKGLIAITKWQVKAMGKNASLLLAQPHTGRTHQLRVHFSGMGHPILGDYIYGKEFLCTYRPKRFLLHAYKIQFVHPITHEKIEIKAAIPKDFLEAKKAVFK